MSVDGVERADRLVAAAGVLLDEYSRCRDVFEQTNETGDAKASLLYAEAARRLLESAGLELAR